VFVPTGSGNISGTGGVIAPVAIAVPQIVAGHLSGAGTGTSGLQTITVNMTGASAFSTSQYYCTVRDTQSTTGSNQAFVLSATRTPSSFQIQASGVATITADFICVGN